MRPVEQIADELIARMNPPPGFRLVQAGQLKPRRIDWQISGLIEHGSFAVIFGPPEASKTFNVLDMGFSIASAKDYHGRQVKPGAVVYIAGEGFNGLARRRKAWEIVHGIDLSDKPVFFSTMPAALLDMENLAAVMRAIDDTGHQPALVILDTLARNYGPGDENSTSDMTAFVAACDQIRMAYGCTVMVVHHTGHGEQGRSRGSSVLQGAIDTAFKVSRDESGVITVENAKMKDAQPPEPFAFKFRTVELGFDNDDGTEATSAVLWPCDMPSRPTAGPKGKNPAIALQMLRKRIQHQRQVLEASGQDPDKARVSVDDWRSDCLDAGIAKRSFYNARDALISANQIAVELGGFVKEVQQ